MNEIIRPLEQIESEIDFYKGQFASNTIEIGKRLIEAKALVKHGEWGKWLEDKAEFSKVTAQRFMKIAEEFSNASPGMHLGTRKLFLLLDVPAEERENFISEPHQVNGETKTVDEMTTRELQKTIKEKQDLEEKLKDSLEFNKKAHELADVRGKERDEALKTLETAKKIANDKSEEAKRLENALKVEKEKLKKEKENSKIELAKIQTFIGEAKDSGDSEEVARLQASLQEIQNDLDSSALKIDELETQLKEKPIDVTETIIEKIPDEVERELEEYRRKASQNDSPLVKKFRENHAVLNQFFQNQLEVMDGIKETDEETYEKCKSAISNLISKMSERL